MDTTRTDRDRAERLAAIIYPDRDTMAWTPGELGDGLHYALLLRNDSHETLGTGATPEAAWAEAYRVLRSRAVAIGDALAAELGAP